MRKKANHKEKLCATCGVRYKPTATTQMYCGSKTKRTGCSWIMVGERDKVRAKLPHRKIQQRQLEKEWKKKQRKNNTEYAQRQRCLRKKWSATEKGKELIKLSNKRNIESKLANNRKRLIKKKNVIGSHTELEWKRLKIEYGNKCANCGIPEGNLSKRYDVKFHSLTKDHIIPISKFGTDNIQNIQPLCVSCNAKKHNKLKNKVVCISGGMDCLTIGHIRLIAHASSFGNVMVILNSDEWLIRKKGYRLMSWENRAEIILALRHVTSVTRVNDSDGTVCEALKRIKPDFFANGGDRNKGNTPELELCKELGIVPLFNIGGGKIQSSQELINAIRKT